jgi:two-component system cell cycle response regulator DivK
VAANNKDVKDWEILVVDDDPDNLDVIRRVLSFYGAQVHTAANGREGLEVLHRIESPTLILIDLSMPTVDGWEMLKAIRQDPGLTSLPVIAVTAHAMSGDKDRALGAGFDGYVAKPFMLHTFMDELKRCLE